jgi:hypothetical protein
MAIRFQSEAEDMADDYSPDQNRKTLRSFYCRDYLWDLFEQMTQELGCSMDYLVNEAMRQYARSRDYAPQEGGQSAGGESGFNQSAPQKGPSGGSVDQVDVNDAGQGPMEHRTFEKMPAVGGENRQRNQQQQSSGGPPPPPGPNQGGGQPGGSQSQKFQQNPGGGRQPNQQQPPSPNESVPPKQQGQQLELIFNGNRYPIQDDRFVIGRGSRNTDLTIRDGNISRQHCAIIYRNNNWYLKDLDSTNGIEFRGSRIESKRIEEGDVFYLCDYPLQFTFR